jgi:quercetin dioxygenase-like cupin family protein
MDLKTVPTQESWVNEDPTQHCHFTFPVLHTEGADSTTMVYFTLNEGKHVGMHRDSAEEVLYIIEGTVEVTVGDETGVISAGHIAIVPKMVPHNVRNIGTGVARVMGFFPENRLVATFEHDWQPVGAAVVDTDQLLLANEAVA